MLRSLGLVPWEIQTAVERSKKLDAGGRVHAQAAAERIWRIEDSQGHMMALAFKQTSLKTFQVVSFSLGSGYQRRLSGFRIRGLVLSLWGLRLSGWSISSDRVQSRCPLIFKEKSFNLKILAMKFTAQNDLH